VPHLSKYPAYRVVNGITTARNWMLCNRARSIQVWDLAKKGQLETYA
jgi:hypothetical protein